MGWRDRDYAKFRKDEFDAIYGRASPDGSYATATSRGAVPRIGQIRRRRRSGVLRALRLPVLAFVGAAVLFGGAIATGKVEDIDSLMHRAFAPAPKAVVAPIQPAVIQMPAIDRTTTTRIAGTRLLQYGSTFSLSGSHSPMAGTIVISGRWGSGPWETFAVARGADRTFAFRLPLTRRGVLHVRIAYPDGARAVGTYSVR